MPSSESERDTPLDAAAAVARYIAVAHRLPTASFPAESIRRAHLGELVDEIDCFVLDGFGVLNVGEAAVPGAAERVEALRAAGCQVRVLTNGASFPSERTRTKYGHWKMVFEPRDVISSRDALARELAGGDERAWGFAALPGSEIERLAPNAFLLGDDPDDYDRAEGFVLLGSGLWNARRQAMLAAALTERERPVLVGNPDIVAPHADGLSREPGLFAHALADDGVAEPRFFGKPFGLAFELVAETLEGIDPRRVAMVGDSPHTDILGGAAFGWRTVLVTDHGLMKTLDVDVGDRAQRHPPRLHRRHHLRVCDGTLRHGSRRRSGAVGASCRSGTVERRIVTSGLAVASLLVVISQTGEGRETHADRIRHRRRAAGAVRLQLGRRRRRARRRDLRGGARRRLGGPRDTARPER